MTSQPHGPVYSLVRICVVLATACVLALPVQAQVFTWTGDASTDDWDEVDFGFPNISNWSGGGSGTFPGAGDVAIFNTDSAGLITVRLNGPRTITTANFAGGLPVTLNESQLRLSSGDLTVNGTSAGYTINSSVLLQSTAFWNIVNPTARLRVNGVISGATSLTKSGSGRLVLNGNNTYTGTTSVNAGVLEIGAGSSTGSIVGNLSNNASVLFNRSNSFTYGGFITGGGSITKLGGGTLTLTGNNTFSGTTTISSGSMSLGNGGASGSLNGAVINNSNLTFNRSTSLTHNGVISGSGSVTKLGGSTLTLTGPNTYTGTTFVNGGTLRIGGGGPTGSISGNISNSANVEFDRSNLISYGGVISGGGTLEKSGAGTLILTGDSSKSGVNTISAGTLQIGGGGTTGSLAGDFTNNANLAFNRSDFFTEASPISGSGTVTQLGSGTLRLTSSNSYTGGTHLVDGVVEFQTVSNLGDASSNVVAQGGALRYTNSSTILSTRNFELSSDLVFDFSSTGTFTLLGDITGPGTLTKAGPGLLSIAGGDLDGVDKVVEGGILRFTGSDALGGNLENNSTIRISRSVDTDFAGLISGSGELVKTFSSTTLTLSGANTYTGDTTIDAGAIAISSDTNLGAGGGVIMGADTTLSVTGTTTAARNFELLLGPATIEVDAGQTYTITGDISSTGAELRKAGDGTLELNGTNSNPGGAVVEAGDLVLANSLSAGTGPIDIQAGSVQVNDDVDVGVAGLPGPTDITIASGATFSTAAGSEATVGPLANIALNGGAITTDRIRLQLGAEIVGAGNVNARVLAATGSTIEANGNLSLGDATSPSGFYSNGDIDTADNTITLLDANDAVLDSGAAVELGDAGTGEIDAASGLTLDFGGNITGFGTIDTPDDPATPLINNGNITGNSLTDPAEPITLTGYVKGVGTCDNCNITGTDAPGFSTATVNRGSVAYNGVLEIELAGVSDFDTLNHILGAGVADLGGTLDVQLLDGFTPTAGDSFEFLTAASVVGEFDTLSLPELAGLDWEISYGATAVSLSVVAGFVLGDTNNDGVVNTLDIDPFVLALTDPAQYQLDFPGAPFPAVADINMDGSVTTLDIDPFVALITGAATANTPEPATLLLLALAGAVSAPRRWAAPTRFSGAA